MAGNLMFPRVREDDAVHFCCNDRNPVNDKLFVID